MSDSVLALDHIRKEFGGGRVRVVAVDDVSLAIKPSEVVLLMGPSGSGKTTLLSIMGCLLRPTSGVVWLVDQETTALPEAALPAIRRRHIGFIFQSFNLLRALTARENVEIALNLAGVGGSAAARRASALLETVGLGERVDFLPSDLSGGEMQRVAIARALANDPQIILADEPTANLDSKTGRMVMDLFSHLARGHGRAVVIVTHDARILDIADRVLHLEDGRLQETP